MLVLTGIALCLSVYLSWAAFTSSKLAGCGGGQVFDCGHVMQTKWSNVLGIPVGLGATALYTALAMSLVVSRITDGVDVRRVSTLLLAFCAITAGLAAIYFIALQLFVVKHLCVYCLAAHTCGLALATFAILNVPWASTLKMGGLSLTGIGVLALRQIVSPPPKSYEIQTHVAPAHSDEMANEDVVEAPVGEESAETDNGSTNNENSVTGNKHETKSNQTSNQSDTQSQSTNNGPPFSQTVPPVAGTQELDQQSETSGSQQKNSKDDSARSDRTVTVAGGGVNLNVGDWPLVGDKKADTIFVEMFDYTCPHCRANHNSVKGAIKALDGKAAVVEIVVSMNRLCNNTVQSDNAQHAVACELAELAIAVWRVAPDKFPDYHEWLFTGDTGPPAAAAKQKAIEFVGEEKLSEELSGKICKQYIEKQVEIYRRIGGGTVPKLLLPGTTGTGKVQSTESLVQIIEQQPKSK